MDVRIAGLPPEAGIRAEGLDAETLAHLRRHWAAMIAPSGPAGGSAVQIRIERTNHPQRRRQRHTTTAGGDLLGLRGGSLRVHPDRDEIRVSLADCHVNLVLDVLDAAMAIALARRGILLLHAAAFRHAACGVVAVGPSGAGKSTLAAAALRAGARIVSDDTVLVRATPAGLEVSPFRSHLGFRDNPAGILTRHAVDRTERVEGDGWVWWRLGLDDLPTSSTVAVLEPDRLWILSVDRRLARCRATRLSQSEGLAALVTAASPLVLSPRYRSTRAVLMPVLQGLAESCRAARVRLAPELLSDPGRAVERLLDLTA